jgi:hypothetical protein
VAALISGNAWLFVLVVVLTLAWAGWLALALLNNVLAAPQRDVIVRLRLTPWPEVAIESRPSPTRGLTKPDPGTQPNQRARAVSSGCPSVPDQAM